jgi:hypothetical protein
MERKERYHEREDDADLNFDKEEEDRVVVKAHQK